MTITQHSSFLLLYARRPIGASPDILISVQPHSWSHSSPRRTLRFGPKETLTNFAKRGRVTPTRCASPASKRPEGQVPWKAWIPRGFSPERILKLISGATSSPIGQFIESPRTFLHSVDPRVKMVWLLALVVLPARSHIYMRAGLVLYLSLLSVLILPTQIWMDQLGRAAFLSGILFIMLGFGSDGVPQAVQLRTPPSSIIGLPDIPSSLGGYSYLVMKLGPFELTRKGLSVATTSACLTFTIFQSASLCLTTTTPEQLASALWWFMYPLNLFGIPVAELILTLLLSLRFINLVFDEVRNIALGIVARRLYWQKLTFLETLDVFFLYVWRIFKNIFNHADQISKDFNEMAFNTSFLLNIALCIVLTSRTFCLFHCTVYLLLNKAMITRGFRGDCKAHKIYFLSKSGFGFVDFASLLCLLGLIVSAILSEKILI